MVTRRGVESKAIDPNLQHWLGVARPGPQEYATLLAFSALFGGFGALFHALFGSR